MSDANFARTTGSVVCTICGAIWPGDQPEQHAKDCPLPKDRLERPLEERLAIYREGKAEIGRLNA